MSRFPKVSETFILNEILELERTGARVEVFPLVRERESVSHAAAHDVVRRAHYLAPLSRELTAAQLAWLRRAPRAYLSAWAGVLRGNARSPRFLARALAAVPLGAAIALRAERAGVGHLHAHYATHPALAAWVASRLTGIPYSFTAHAHDIYVERPMLREKIREAAFVRAISRYNRDLLVRLYGADAAARTVVVPTGVDPSRFRPASRPRIGDADGTLRAICVASLQDYKGHRWLVEACALLRREGRELRCLLVGEGEERRRIERLVDRHGLEREVLLCGAQPTERVQRLVREADVLVLPSVVTETGKKEGIPVALMEALAAETPVVATAISGIPELVEDGVSGLLVPQRDASALAAALARLQDDPELRRRLGAQGRERILRDYDVRRSAARLAELVASAE